MRERIAAVLAAMRRRLSNRAALITLVVILTPLAIVLASRITDPGPPALTEVAPTVETSNTSPPSATPTPEPRGQRQAPSAWQLETRSNPELAARYPLADLYTADEIAYFKEIAFGSDTSANSSLDPDLVRTIVENRPAGSGDRIGKWDDGEVGYYVAGSPTASDLAEIESIISKLESLIPTLRFRALELSEAEVDVSMFIAFAGENDYLLEGVVASNWMSYAGLGGIGGDSFVIEKAVIFINSDHPEEIRRRAIVEEITQALGLTNDSWWYPDSRFYQGFSIKPGLADIDEALIRLLYDPRIKPGMTIEDLERMGL
ncbi:MAG: DUF2927 domain-containing protein [Chloroflexi bacterium]|nr:DUF2927 domain-containing protein [Chloroflexota bacterium]MCY3938648.1 DUF2927 domain-containing protein [Chloroflexota bacterium]